MVQPPGDLKRFESLLEVVEALRGPEGCPWDKEQTHQTLTPYAIEEAHELAEAIEAGRESDMVSELGDLLLQVVLHAEIGRQAGRFDISHVIYAITEKMVRRHPHVFADVKVADSKEVLANWSEIKSKEKKSTSSLDRFDVPVSLPALARSHKIGEKTKRQRFDWPNAIEVMKKVDEEIGELKAELVDGGKNKEAVAHEIGDVLFSVAQLARHLDLEPEQCLRTANARFEKRYFKMFEILRSEGKDLASVSTDEMEIAWEKVKKALKD